jgi:acyl carrier protein
MSCPSPEQNENDAILRKVIEAAIGLTEDWDRAFADPIGPDTRLVADLGCQSLDIVVLTANLSRQLQRDDIPFERLFLSDGKPVRDISIRALAEFLCEPNQRAQSPISAARGA